MFLWVYYQRQTVLTFLFSQKETNTILTCGSKNSKESCFMKLYLHQDYVKCTPCPYSYNTLPAPKSDLLGLSSYFKVFTYRYSI